MLICVSTQLKIKDIAIVTNTVLNIQSMRLRLALLRARFHLLLHAYDDRAKADVPSCMSRYLGAIIFSTYRSLLLEM